MKITFASKFENELSSAQQRIGKKPQMNW